VFELSRVIPPNEVGKKIPDYSSAKFCPSNLISASKKADLSGQIYP
jgi:hypothetical protein